MVGTFADRRCTEDTTTAVLNWTVVMNHPSRFLWRLNSVASGAGGPAVVGWDVCWNLFPV